MKYLILALLAFGVFAPTEQAQAQSRSVQRAWRHKVHYRDFDRGFYRTYGYRETYYSQSYCSGYYTCYTDYSPTTVVYVEEVDLSNGCRRVTVYRDEYYTNVYSEYYVESGVVVTRHHHWGHYDPWYGPGYNEYYYSHTYLVIDFSTVEGKLATGLIVGAHGLAILADCRTDECAAVGGLLLLSASVSSVAAAEQAETELAKNIQASSKDSASSDNDLQ